MQWPVVVAFKLNWLGAFFWGNTALPYMLLGLALLMYLQVRRYGFRVLAPCALLALLGLTIDSALLGFGVLDFSQPGLPMYMVLLWGSFALFLPTVQTLLGPRSVWFVAIMGPVSYYLASVNQLFSLNLGAVLSLLILFPLWLMLAYLSVRLLRECDA